MAVFIPPTALRVPPVLPETRGVQRSLFRHYGLNPQGLSVVFRAGHYVIAENPGVDELAPLTEGVTYFLGGHQYVVSDAVGALLLADGFITVDDTGPFGGGGFGQGGFG